MNFLQSRYLLWVDILMFFLGFGLVFVIAFAWAENNPPATEPEEGEVWEDRLERSTPHVRDSSLTAAVETALALDRDVGEYPLGVKTQGGIVTLTGQVRSAKEEKTALRLARRTPGIEGVIDRIEVDAKAPRRAAPAPNQRAEADQGA